MRPAEAELPEEPTPSEVEPSRVFREVNDRIRILMSSAESATRREFICECADPDCLDFVSLTLAQYDAIRATRRALLAPRHQNGADGAAAARRRQSSPRSR